MKKIVFFTLISCFLSQVHAQSVLPDRASQNPQATKHLRLIRSLLKQQNSSVAVEKPTAIRQRVIAQAVSDESGLDSITFRYSGSRGSEYDFNNTDIGYRDYFADFYEPADMLYGPAPSSMLADSISWYEDGGTLSDLTYAYYRDDNQIDSFFEHDVTGGVPDYKYLKIYDAQGYLSEVYDVHNGVMGYDTLLKQGIYYNNDYSQVLSDTFWIHPPTGFEVGSANQYYYSATGKLDSFILLDGFGGPLEPSERTILTYYPDNRIQTVSVYNLPQGDMTYRDTFAYTPGTDYYTQWIQEYWFAGSYEGGFQIRQYPGANGSPDSLHAFEKETGAEPWEATARLVYQYNSYDNPVSATITFTDNSPGGEMTFYYEEYDDTDTTESIKPVSANADLRVYPNPFARQINIDYSGKNLTDPLQLSLTNVLGQTVLERTVRLRKGNNILSLPEMAPGNYYLLLKTTDGQCWSKQLLKR